MHSPQRLIKLILNNCSEVAEFALSRSEARAFRDRHQGPWDSLDVILFELPEQRADRALLELGVLLRALDDLDNLNATLFAMNDPPYGVVVTNDSEDDLFFRDMTNKIMHAHGFRWETDDKYGPIITCIGRDQDRWIEARIWLDRLIQLCGQFEA